MSQCAPGWESFQGAVDRHIGTGFNSGCTANLATHPYGYHLTPSEIRNIFRSWGTDYSTKAARDRNPACDCACAKDLGMGWNGSRHWLAWLVKRLQGGAYPDVCEVIGSLDGSNVQYWRGPAFVTERYNGEGHDTWTHLSCWRDSATRDKSALITDWLAAGRPGSGIVVPAPRSPGGTGRGLDDVSLDDKVTFEGEELSLRGLFLRVLGNTRDIKGALTAVTNAATQTATAVAGLSTAIAGLNTTAAALQQAATQLAAVKPTAGGVDVDVLVTEIANRLKRDA